MYSSFLSNVTDRPIVLFVLRSLTRVLLHKVLQANREASLFWGGTSPVKCRQTMQFVFRMSSVRKCHAEVARPDNAAPREAEVFDQSTAARRVLSCFFPLLSFTFFSQLSVTLICSPASTAFRPSNINLTGEKTLAIQHSSELFRYSKSPRVGVGR